jgi:hypothetical protein
MYLRCCLLALCFQVPLLLDSGHRNDLDKLKSTLDEVCWHWLVLERSSAGNSAQSAILSAQVAGPQQIGCRTRWHCTPRHRQCVVTRAKAASCICYQQLVCPPPELHSGSCRHGSTP